MRKKKRYPLAEIASIKDKRLEEAEKILREKKETLKKEEESLQKALAKRDKVLAHKQEKLLKHLQEMEEGTTSDKIELGERYLKKVVEEDLKREEKKVKEQRDIVKKAEQAVEEARTVRMERFQDVEKIRLHHAAWLKEEKFKEAREEGHLNDELGSNMFTLNKKKKSS